MKIKQLRTTYHCLALGLFVSALLLLVGCSVEEDPNTLPDGKYPISFTAMVEGQTTLQTATRVDEPTTPIGKEAWTLNEEIAVSTNADGSDHQIYKITDVATGTMALADGSSPLYWHNSSYQPIMAWCPAAAVASQTIENQSTGWASFDYLVSNEAHKYVGTNALLKFTHAMAKVRVTLSAGNGITSDEIKTATVRIMGYTEAAFSNGVVSGVNGTSGGEIIPRVDESSSTSNSILYEAIVVPQQMQGKRFIKVTVSGNDYYYIPTGSNDANLAAGKLNTYNVTVQKKTLLVYGVPPLSWGEGTTASGEYPSQINYHAINITNKDDVNSLEVKDADGNVITAEADGSYRLPATASTFSINYSTSDYTKSIYPVYGLCKMVRSFDSTTSKFTINYSNVLTDINLTLGEYVASGDYYFSDGTWGPSILTAGAGIPTAIGVVFYAGAGKDDSISKYAGTGLTGKIRGYVIAAKDLLNGATTSFGGKLPLNEQNNLQNFDVPEIINTKEYSYNGYEITQMIKNQYLSDASHYSFPAFAACDTYQNDVQAAPTGSSGWYLPSAYMMSAINSVKGNLANCANGTVVNADYLTTTETDASNVKGFAFHNNQYTSRSKNDNRTRARAVLTF